MSRVRFALAGGLAAILVATMGATAHADPNAVAQAREKLEAIQQESSALDQKLITTHERVAKAEEKLKTLTADLKAQEKKVAGMADQMGDVATLQMQQSSFGMTAQLLTGSSSENFLSGLATYQSEIDRANAGVQQFQLDQAKLATLREDAEATEAQLKKDEAATKKLAEEYQAKEDEAQRVYDRLSDEERQRLAAEQAAAEAAAAARAEEAAAASRSRTAAAAPADTTTPPVTVDASGRAAGAVSAALSKVGSAYVWGTSGPNTFDCSGLTSWAYRQVGITLSRSSSAQWSGAGRRVSVSDIQPGDLVFYYSPVSHVGMYIGNGMIVHAANPRTDVTTASLFSMPLTGVRRVVG